MKLYNALLNINKIVYGTNARNLKKDKTNNNDTIKSTNNQILNKSNFAKIKENTKNIDNQSIEEAIQHRIKIIEDIKKTIKQANFSKNQNNNFVDNNTPQSMKAEKQRYTEFNKLPKNTQTNPDSHKIETKKPAIKNTNDNKKGLIKYVLNNPELLQNGSYTQKSYNMKEAEELFRSKDLENQLNNDPKNIINSLLNDEDKKIIYKDCDHVYVTDNSYLKVLNALKSLQPKWAFYSIGDGYNWPVHFALTEIEKMQKSPNNIPSKAIIRETENLIKYAAESYYRIEHRNLSDNGEQNLRLLEDKVSDSRKIINGIMDANQKSLDIFKQIRKSYRTYEKTLLNDKKEKASYLNEENLYRMKAESKNNKEEDKAEFIEELIAWKRCVLNDLNPKTNPSIINAGLNKKSIEHIQETTKKAINTLHTDKNFEAAKEELKVAREKYVEYIEIIVDATNKQDTGILDNPLSVAFSDDRRSSYDITDNEIRFMCIYPIPKDINNQSDYLETNKDEKIDAQDPLSTEEKAKN